MPALEYFSQTQQQMLNSLKKHGAQSAEDLAQVTNISVSGIRQHLASLEASGLVMFQDTRQGRGRPKRRYALTHAAESLYPRTYSELTNELLDYVGEENPELLEQIFVKRRHRRLHDAQRRLAIQPSQSAKLEELCKILDEDGYLCELEAVSATQHRLIEHNCAILGVALRYGQACQSELEFIRLALPEMRVERVAHMVAGAHTCTYLLTATPTQNLLK
jgi:DeoR family transcriptional regulator, suf operon transcriptional repressor